MVLILRIVNSMANVLRSNQNNSNGRGTDTLQCISNVFPLFDIIANLISLHAHIVLNGSF